MFIFDILKAQPIKRLKKKRTQVYGPTYHITKKYTTSRVTRSLIKYYIAMQTVLSLDSCKTMLKITMLLTMLPIWPYGIIVTMLHNLKGSRG